MRILIFLIWLVCLISPPATAQIDFLVAGIGSSLLLKQAGDRFSDAVDYARATASALLDQADDIGRKRLKQIDSIIEDTVGGLIDKTETRAIKVLQESTTAMLVLEARAFNDLKKIIWEAECAGKRLTLQDLPQALGGLGKMANMNKIRITPPIEVETESPWYSRICFWCDDPYVVKVMEPFGYTYLAVQKIIETSIASENVKESTPAHRIVDSWEYLSAFALKTSCFYKGSERAWNREYVNYREKARQWRNVVYIKPA